MLRLLVDIYVDEGIGEVGSSEVSIKWVLVVEKLANFGVGYKKFGIKHAGIVLVSSKFNVIFFSRGFGQQLSGPMNNFLLDWKGRRRSNPRGFGF